MPAGCVLVRAQYTQRRRPRAVPSVLQIVIALMNAPGANLPTPTPVSLGAAAATAAGRPPPQTRTSR